jgi:nucleoid-associated protein YgaU
MADTFKKASLSIEVGGTVNCLFNPKDLSITKANTWGKADTKAGATSQLPAFTGGQPRELALQLLFDETLLTPQMTVKAVGDLLFKSMKAQLAQGGDKNKTRPPTMTFTWGGFSFYGVAKSLTVQYQLFKPNGDPIRADVKLSLTEIDEDDTPKGQNPTTRSSGSVGAHVVRDGDSLASIAHEIYGDPTHWRVIAQANNIDNPLTLRSGQALSVPSLD